MTDQAETKDSEYSIDFKGSFVRPAFVYRMNGELLSNSARKGEWMSWQPDKLLLVAEFNWLLAKLVQAILDDDPERVSEHAADIANYAMKADEIYCEK